MFASRCIGGLKIPCIVFYIIAVISIFAYGYFIRKSGRPDALERYITEDPSVQNLDGWAMTHLFLWTFLGFWYPGRYLQALGISLAWEGFEDTLGRTRITVGGSRLQLIGHVDDETCTHTDDSDEQFWYGRYTTDTAYNLMGYIIGSALAKRFWPEGACKCVACAASPQGKKA
jgi:hypothetical protein